MGQKIKSQSQSQSQSRSKDRSLRQLLHDLSAVLFVGAALAGDSRLAAYQSFDAIFCRSCRRLRSFDLALKKIAACGGWYGWEKWVGCQAAFASKLCSYESTAKRAPLLPFTTQQDER
jgi:hypothetical protein